MSRFLCNIRFLWIVFSCVSDFTDELARAGPSEGGKGERATQGWRGARGGEVGHLGVEGRGERVGKGMESHLSLLPRVWSVV